jgi:hypothetical protein
MPKDNRPILPNKSKGFTANCRHWLDNASAIAGAVQLWVGQTRVYIPYCFIEWPGIFSGDATSQAAAAKGDLFKLAALFGCLSSRLDQLDCLAIPLPVARWKGQMPKDAVRRRIARAYGLKRAERFPDHVEDAVGMGLAAQGLL